MSNIRLDREYRFLNPDDIDEDSLPEVTGTNAECLADSLLDIIQLALENGMSEEDVTEALAIIQETLATSRRRQFRLHTRDE